MPKTHSTMTIELSDEDVKEAIKAWLSKTQGGDWTVSVEAKMESVGIGRVDDLEPVAKITATKRLTSTKS
jgi:hypothetical protein